MTKTRLLTDRLEWANSFIDVMLENSDADPNDLIAANGVKRNVKDALEIANDLDRTMRAIRRIVKAYNRGEFTAEDVAVNLVEVIENDKL